MHLPHCSISVKEDGEGHGGRSRRQRGRGMSKEPAPHSTAKVTEDAQSSALPRSGSGGRIPTQVHSPPKPMLCPLSLHHLRI